MSEGPGPVERLLDLAVYAPLGLVLRAWDEIPRLATEGRQRFTRQAPMARMVGRMAVAQGRRKVESFRRPAGSGDADPAASDASAPRPRLVADPPPDGPGDEPATGTVHAADLPIPGYDSLSASQVVQRLAGLSPEELDAVRAYELAGRGRKTVLLRVAQLRTAG